MKLAYCLTGLIDSPEITLEGLREFKESSDADFFIHTWDHECNPGLEKIHMFEDIATDISVTSYDDFTETVSNIPAIQTMYAEKGEGKPFDSFIKLNLAQFYSTIQSVKLAYKHYDYPVVIKARSNLRYDVVSNNANCPEFKKYAARVLAKEPEVWAHGGIDYTLTDDEGYDVSTVYMKTINFPAWRWQTSFHDVLFAMEKKFVERKLFSDRFLPKIVDEYIQNGRNGFLPYSADKIWYNYMMNNNVGIFNMPINFHVVRDRADKIII